MKQSEITEWELENQHNIVRFEIHYGRDEDVIIFEMKDKTVINFLRTH